MNVRPFWRSKTVVAGGRRLKMAWSLDKCGGNFPEKLYPVYPAMEVHAGEAVEAIKRGQVIAIPTDTLYGFACDACSLEAVNRIYEIKGRKYTSPLAIICVGDVSDIPRLLPQPIYPMACLMLFFQDLLLSY